MLPVAQLIARVVERGDVTLNDTMVVMVEGGGPREVRRSTKTKERKEKGWIFSLGQGSNAAHCSRFSIFTRVPPHFPLKKFSTLTTENIEKMKSMFSILHAF